MRDNRPHLAFALEQTLGHVTHSANLRAALSDDRTARISWIPIEYYTTDPWRHLPLLSRNWSLTGSLMARRKLRCLNQQRRIDGYFFHTQVIAFGALDLMRQRPVVVSLDATPRGFDTIGAAYGHASGGPLDGIKHVLSRAVLRNAAALVTWSAWAKASLVAEYGVPDERVSVIPPGTDLNLWNVERSPRSVDAPVRILFVGGDFARKGGQDLLAACADFLPGRCEVHLVTRTPIEASPGVTVYPAIVPNSAELRHLYAKADIFALPTYADGLPMVLMEAAAAGLPMVSTPVGAIPEVVNDGRTGFLVQAGDVAALRTAIKTLIEQPERGRVMGQAARQAAETRFDARANAQRVRDLLLETIAVWPTRGDRAPRPYRNVISGKRC